MAQQDSSNSTKVSSAQYIKVATKNMSKIHDSCETNVELQMLVLNTISEYQSAAEVATASGVATGAVLGVKRRRNSGGASSRGTGASGAASVYGSSTHPDVPVIGDDEMLPSSLKEWKIGLCRI